MSSDVFLLGAGFSRAVSAHMPLLPDLARGVLEAYPHRARLTPEIVALIEADFAHALSYLEHPKPWLTESENLRHRGLFLEFSYIIAELLDDAVRRTSATLENDMPGWLAALLQHWHQERCTVITLNHDTLVETVAAGMEFEGQPLWSHAIYPPLLTDARLRAGDWERFEPRDTFLLLKLHGSTNWFYSGRTSATGEPIYFVAPSRLQPAEDPAFSRQMRAVADKYPFLVPPIFDQSNLLTHETIRAFWLQAGQALGRTQRLVCMGYSLPPSDVIMHHFLRTTLGDGVTLEIVDESPDVLRNYQSALGRAGVSLRADYAGHASIERFVRSLGAPPAAAEAADKAQMARR